MRKAGWEGREGEELVGSKARERSEVLRELLRDGAYALLVCWGGGVRGKAGRKGELKGGWVVVWKFADGSRVSRTSFQSGGIQDPIRSHDGPDQGEVARGVSRQRGLCTPKVDVRTKMKLQFPCAREHSICERSLTDSPEGCLVHHQATSAIFWNSRRSCAGRSGAG